MRPDSNIFLLLIVCILSFSCLQAEKKDSKITIQADYSEAIKYAQKRVDQIAKKQHLPGFAVALIDDQEIIYQSTSGFADIDKNITITSDTYFKIWSIAKAFTAIEIFREVEEGLIDLDKPISNYLPDFNIQSIEDITKPITVRNILAHRSGLPRNECISVKGKYGDPLSLEKFERSIHDCFMSFPPEKRYKYSNLGYDLLGRIVEENRQEGFADYMNTSVLPSLGMAKSTFSSKSISQTEVIATGYEYYKGQYYPKNQVGDISSVPSGNLYSTIEDLSLFLKALIANSEVFNQKETLSRMFQDHYSSINDPETMGLGWKTSIILDSELMVWHDGGPDDGTGALIAFLPESKLGVVLISNSTGFGGNISVPLAVEIFESMLESKTGLESNKLEKEKRVEINEELLVAYEGKYAAFGQIMEVTSKRNKLKGTISGIGLDLIPVSDTRFKITHWMHKIGLTKIFKPPVDFDKVKIEFINCELSGSCTMVINLDDISFEICPKYPSVQNVPVTWSQLLGTYQISERLNGDKAGDIWEGRYAISIDNNVMAMSQPFGPIIPLDNQFIIIVSGPFAGEKMLYSPDSGNIIHQNAVFIKIDSD